MNKIRSRGTLYELGQEYLAAAQTQTEAIRQVRERYNQLPNKSFGTEAYRLRSLLQMMYQQRRDLLATGRYLCEYYDCGSGKIGEEGKKCE